MKYRALLIDADETLFDFLKAEENAIGQVNAHLGIRDPDAPGAYSRINARYWLKFEKGLVTQEQIKIGRFADYLREYWIDADPKAVSEMYVEALSGQCILLDGALETLDALRGRLPIALVTNGISKVQRSRLDKGGLWGYFDQVIISQEIGVQKPDPRMVDAALAALGGIAREDALLCGDSLTSDIKAANNAGVDACWYNPSGKALPEGMRAEYRIKDIRELPGVLAGERRAESAFAREIPFALTAREVAEKLRVGEDDLEEALPLFEEALRAARPKAAYRRARVKPMPGGAVLDGVAFESELLEKNLRGRAWAYPFVITCGQEIYQRVRAQADPVLRYWLESAAEMVLRRAAGPAFDAIRAAYHTDARYTMNPGSLAQWPIADQRPLFGLLGDVEGEIGVRLTDSMLMTPVKSISGILFSSQEEYTNCGLCTRENCPSRREPYHA